VAAGSAAGVGCRAPVAGRAIALTRVPGRSPSGRPARGCGITRSSATKAAVRTASSTRSGCARNCARCTRPTDPGGWCRSGRWGSPGGRRCDPFGKPITFSRSTPGAGRADSSTSRRAAVDVTRPRLRGTA